MASITDVVNALYDYAGIVYTSGNLTSITYKYEGVSGIILTTMSITYDTSNNITSITRV